MKDEASWFLRKAAGCPLPQALVGPRRVRQHFAKAGLIDPKFHRWLLDSYDDRIRGDYDTEAVIGEESAG